MEKITSPLQANDKGTKVKALHEALLIIVAKLTVDDLNTLLEDGKFLRQWENENKKSVFGKATQQAVALFQQKEMGIKPTGKVDRNTAAAINKLIGNTATKAPQTKSMDSKLRVSGVVYDEWIEPMKDAPVMIFEKDMRSEHLLAEGKTDKKGNYSIGYSKNKLSRDDKNGADLVVKLYGTDGQLLYTSPVFYNAPAQLQANINLGPRAFMGPSEFVNTEGKVRDLSGKLAIDELSENKQTQDISFLVSKTGIAVNTLLQLVASFRFQKWTGLDAEVFYGILAGIKVFPPTGVGTGTLPEDVDGGIEKAYINFWNASVANMIKALQQAADNNTVTYKLLEKKQAISDALQKLKMAPPRASESSQSLPPVYANTKTAGLNPAQQQAFLDLYTQGAMGPSFWNTLAKNPGFQGETGTAMVNKLQAVYQLADWTSNNTSLTAYIAQKYTIASLNDFRALVSNTAADWTKIIHSSGVVPSGSDQDKTVQGLANAIAGGVEKLFPTAVFADRFSKATSLKVSNRPYISSVLESNDFNLFSSSAVQYLNTYVQKNPLPEGASQNTIAHQLMTMQRVHKISQVSDTSLVLLGSNIQSAKQIYAMGKGNFVSGFQEKLGGVKSAEKVYNQAADIHAGAVYLTGQLISKTNNPGGNIMPDYNDELKNSSLAKTYPDLANLFGMGSSYCECTDCSSFLGTPAYLADLLDFLAKRLTIPGTSTQTPPPPNARAVLLADGRRPDIGDIDLSCDNANVELPYIDIVNELLEDYVIPPVACLKIAVNSSLEISAWLAANIIPGKINNVLFSLIQLIAQDPKTPICNISLLTSDAVLSDPYFTFDFNFPIWIGGVEDFVNLPQVVIRDKFITLKLYFVPNGGDVSINLNCIPVDQASQGQPASGTPPATVEVIHDNEVSQPRPSKGITSFSIIVQEIHETHLSTDEISSNPEYTNTNIYNCFADPFNDFGHNLWGLYPTRIPMSLPFDLYFKQANVYLEKMGKKRYDLINTFRKQSTGPGGLTLSIDSIVQAYFAFSPGDADIILVARVPQQLKFWGSIAVLSQVEVDLFLMASGLSFTELQTLLTLDFINPAHDSIITNAASFIENCNTAGMLIINMTPDKFDRMNRFIRLWNKVKILTTVSMDELSDCIMSTAIGNGTLDDSFAVNFYYFLQTMTLMNIYGLTVTQALVLYQNINTTGEDSLYRQLFQNRQVSNPLVAAFQLSPTGQTLAPTTLITDTNANPGAVPVILAACGITSADLSAIISIGNLTYGNLTVDNLSFIYACGLLAGALSITVSDLLTFTGLLGINPLRQILVAPAAVASPKSTFDFITAFNALPASMGIDGLNYILTNQSNQTPSLVPAPTDVVAGLTNFRNAIQQAVAITTPVPDPQGDLLKKWLADPDLNWDKNITGALLAILAGTGNGTYGVQVQNNLRFLQLLQTKYNTPSVKTYLEQLPAISFPDKSITGIFYDNTKYYLFYYGTMSADFCNYLISVAPDAVSKTAVQNLFQQSQACPFSAIELIGAPLTPSPAWVGTASIQIPAFSGGTGVLGFTGPMTGAVYAALLAQSSDSTYDCALTQLFIASQSAAAAANTLVQLVALPTVALPDFNAASLAYNASARQLSFIGTMSAADARALLALAPDTSYQLAICSLYSSSVAGKTVSAPLSALPAGWTAVPDLTGISGLSFNNGTLGISSAITPAQLGTLLGLSGDQAYANAVNLLSFQSNQGLPATVALQTLPGTVTLPLTAVPGLTFSPPALVFKGQMSASVKTALSSLDNSNAWLTAIKTLFDHSQSSIVANTPITALPAGVTAASLALNGVGYTAAAGTTPATLNYTGTMSDVVYDLLLAYSTDPDWADVVTTLYQNAQASLVSAVQLTLPAGLTDASFAGISGITSVTTAGATVVSAAGQLTPAIRQQLLALSKEPDYVDAVGYLFNQYSAIIDADLPAILLPLPDNNIFTAQYSDGAIVFTGTPNVDSMDQFDLLQLNTDLSYQGAINWIYTPAPSTIPAGSVGAALNALPAITLPAGIGVSWAGGQLGFTGQMQAGVYSTLQSLSNDLSYQSALGALLAGSQITSQLFLNLAALPAGVTAAGLLTLGVNCQQAQGGFDLFYTGLMTAATQTALLALDSTTNATYQGAVNSLFTQSQTQVQCMVQLAALPPVTIPSSTSAFYDNANGILYYSGALPMSVSTVSALNNLSNAPEYLAAIKKIAGVTANPGNYMVFAPPPQTAFAVAASALSSGSIAYQGGTLGFTGVMSLADYIGLRALSPNQAYQAVLSDLYTRSQSSTATTNIQSTDYFGLPAISFPAIYSNQISFVSSNNTLTIRGFISAADQSVLLSLGVDSFYQQAVKILYNEISTAGAAPGTNYFAGLYESLWPIKFGVPQTPAGPDLYGYFLNAISVVYQPLKKTDALITQIAGTFSVTAGIALALVNGLTGLFASLTDPGFAGNSKAINPDPNQSPQALWYMKLARITYLSAQLKLAAADINWLLKNAGTIGAIPLDAYPRASSPLPYSAWAVLNNLSVFQRSHKPLLVTDPENFGSKISLSVYTIVSAALQLQVSLAGVPTPGILLNQLITLTGWNKNELLYLLDIGQPSPPNLAINPLDLQNTGNPAVGCATDLSDISILLRISDCFAIAKQMKIVPSRCITWIIDPLTDVTAIDIKNALKSQYPNASSWSKTIRPLMNTLRQARRDALVEYLLFNQVINIFGNFDPFTDEFAIYGNFLIDVEMGACQATTRIIQAYCSIQLFVQRILLNLETPSLVADASVDFDWTEWAWMGTFEAWHLARYVFLFPENLVIPQTLPYQTPFYADFQNDLNQGPLTPAIAETAFENYVESLDEIARLKIRGMWYDEPTGNLHVFGSTYGGEPQIYFYRVLNAVQQWGSWAKVTADISGDQIIPVVQNGRLYLYWPVFTQVSDDDKSSQSVPAQGSSGSTTPPPNKYWKIQMAFSEYRNGKWSGKKMSKDFLTSSPIVVAQGNPIIYPDTSDFVFIALDIPPMNTDIITGTYNSIETNNTMALVCYQNLHKYQVITINVTIKKDGNDWVGENYTIPVNILNQIFQIGDLLYQIADTIYYQTGFYPSNANHNAPVQLNLGNPNPSDVTTWYVNSLNISYNDGSNDHSITIAINSITISLLDSGPYSDSLNIIKSGGLNAFLLDPLRGFPTAINFQGITNYQANLPHNWFYANEFNNNLLDGAGPLATVNDIPILNGGVVYSTLLSLQMGLQAKCHVISGEPADLNNLGILMPFFYQDTARTFFTTQSGPLLGFPVVTYEGAAFLFTTLFGLQSYPGVTADLLGISGAYTNGKWGSGPNYQFNNFYHPFAHFFIKIIAQYGAAGFISRAVQLTGDPDDGAMAEVKANLIYKGGYRDFNFSNNYAPAASVININNSPYAGGYPIEQMDFDPGSSYSQYNWELFFHNVLLTAMQLSQNQQFAEADACFKLIFNPTDSSSDPSPQKFWVTKPFYKNITSGVTIEDWVTLFTLDPTLPIVQQFRQSVELWKHDPYDPHILALYRKTPYMYATFMKYLDNLIAWANFNYAQYTMETVNLAIELYMLALELLGTKPEAIPPVVKTPVLTYNQMEANLDFLIVVDGEGYLSDPIVQVENLLPPSSGSATTGPAPGQKLQTLNALYFCIPPNAVLLGYWDTIEKELNKIRNCMNIQGQFQPLSPFPSVPGFGNPDGSGISDFGGIIPNYRFSVMIQKATEFCNEVKSLGGALLSALEKQDAEGLSLLRSGQEIAVQKSIDLVKQLQVTDAQLGLQNLQNYQSLINDKITYYSGLVKNGGLIPLEQQALVLNQFALALEGPITAATIIASVLKLIPNFNMGVEGFGGSPEVTFSLGGQQLGGAADCFVEMLNFAAHYAEKSASIATTNAGYTRRLAEWNFQLTLANDELTQVKSQIQAAQNKIEIAKQEETNQQMLIQNAEDVDSFLKSKYTNQQLYSWMVTKIANIYFQSYQVAYGFAKQTEICFRYELGITDTNYISYGYWDSLNKGLLSGDGLMSSLKQMEADYYNLNAREYELTRQISLAQLDPVALLQLKAGGGCFINIPEELFDLDYPGHYFRRVKHIAITIPGVVGPYTPVSLKMTLLSNSVRIDNTAGAANNYARHTDSKGSPATDSRFLDNVAAMQYIATSNGVNDSGLFEMNLHDERYLPFERAGAISTWQLEFTGAYPQFDLATISDLIIHFSYTSRDGGAALQTVAAQSIQTKLKAALSAQGMVLMRGFSARRDFPTQWYKFLNPANPGDLQQLVMDTTDRFPFFTNGLSIKISQVVLVADVPGDGSSSGTVSDALSNLYLSGQKLSNALINFGPDPDFGPMPYAILPCKDKAGKWIISNGTAQDVSATSISGSDINDIAIIFYYSLVNNNI